MRTVEAPRPGFADELLARLERDGFTPFPSPVLRRTLTGAAVTASVVLLVAGRRRSR
jgi:hypothetical protein